ncbi:hypothetical protein [Methanopyrus sp.]
MSEESFNGKHASRVFGIPDDFVKVVVTNATSEINYRRSKFERCVEIRIPDEIWPVGRAVSRLASYARKSLVRAAGGGVEPWEALDSVLGSGDVGSPFLRKLRTLVNGRGPIGFPTLIPSATLIAWGVNPQELPETLEDMVNPPSVPTLVSLAVLDDVAETLLDGLGDRAERLSGAFRRAFDDRAAKLLGTCLCAWLSEKLDGFEGWWEEGGSWRALYRLVREDRLIERVVEERTGVRPGSQ